MYFAGLVKEGASASSSTTATSPIDNHGRRAPTATRSIRTAVFDLDAGPVTITLPDAGKRFMSMMVIDEDHYVLTSRLRGRRSHATRERRSAHDTLVAAIRTLVDPDDPKDVKQVHALQDAIKVEQPGGPGSFEVPNWDQASQKKVRDALLVLGETLPDCGMRRGRKERGRSGPAPDRHGLGLGPQSREGRDLSQRHAGKNDGKTIYRLNVKDVPVDGFWSISVYDAKGYFEPEQPYNAYSLNNITAKKNADGSVAIQFGGCDGKIPNCLPIMTGWNYMVRLYRPRAEILNGTWKFPEAKPTS